MKLKICGIRNQEMVNFCNENKIDYAGFNFVPISRRKIKLNYARFLIRKLKNTIPIALFMDQRFDEIAVVLKSMLFPIIQLHGRENIKLLQKIRENFPNIQILKVFSGDFMTLENLTKYKKYSIAYLFDGNLAGSGQVIKNTQNLAIAIKFCEENNMKYGIAGGINAENISKFREIYASAYFLDTASGVEKNKEFDLVTAQQLVSK